MQSSMPKMGMAEDRSQSLGTPGGTTAENLTAPKQATRKPERLVYAHCSDVDNDPGQFHVTVTFAEEGPKTRLTLRSLFVSAAVRDKVVDEHGAIEGGNQTLDRLAAYLRTAE